MSFSVLRRLTGVVFAAATLLAAPAAFAQTYLVHRTFSSIDGETGTAVLEMANSTLADGAVGNGSTVPVELVSATLTFNNLGVAPSTTTFTRSQLSGFLLSRSGGEITDVAFWSSPNPDGYSLDASGPTYTDLYKGVYSANFTNSAPAAAPAAVPTLSEWAMIGFALALAGGAALMIQRRRVGQTA